MKYHFASPLHLFVTIFLSIFPQVIAITEEMLESSTVIRISNLLPNLFYMENYDKRLRHHLTRLLLNSKSLSPLNSITASGSMEDNVYILSVQEADPLHSKVNSKYGSSNPAVHDIRYKRSLGTAIDILVAVYDPQQRSFIRPHTIAQAVNGIAAQLSTEFGGEVDVILDVCTPQVSNPLS